jgi:rod shape-determining protein MreB
VYILEEPMAAAIGVGLDVDSSTACMIADIGGGTTDIAIIALGGIVASSSIRHAGDKFNDAIIQYMRKRHALMIGEKTAEQLKIKVGTAAMDIDENGDEVIETTMASGRDIISGLPKTMEVTNRDMLTALEESVDIIVDGIKATIEKAPPEIAADIAGRGIVLSGGGGMIHNLGQVIEKRTGMRATIAENAFEAVALGTGMSLNDIEKLKVYATSIKRR